VKRFQCHSPVPALIGLLAFTVSFGRPDLIAQGAAEAEIRSVLDEFATGWNTADASRAAVTFTRDGVLIAGDGKRVQGISPIEAYLGRLLTTLPKGTRFVMSTTRIAMLAADVALVESEGGFLLPGEQVIAPARHGIQSVVMVRENGLWRAVLAQRTRVVAGATSKSPRP
jgi:uncharacterized protein (TIGR02246 family)